MLMSKHKGSTAPTLSCLSLSNKEIIMYRANATQLAGFFQRFLLQQQQGWGQPRWALQELERLMQWQSLQMPAPFYKHHW